MQRGRRAAFVFVVLIAATIALEPLVHTHPLSQTSNATCAVCVGFVGSLPSLEPAPTAPLTVVAAVSVLPIAPIVHRTTLPLASRAPPSL